MKSTLFLITPVVHALLSSSLLAHPGHGKDGGSHGFGHYLTQHLPVLAVLVLVAITAGVLLQRRKARSSRA